MAVKLSRANRKLHDFLEGRGPTHVFHIYRAIRGTNPPPTERLCQQHLGNPISRYNRRSESHRIVPANEPYTYVLTPKD